MTFEFTVRHVHSNYDGEENEYTAERIVTYNPDATTPGTRLHKVC